MREAIEMQREYIKQALDLIRENPELPIIPLVNYEVVADDALYWMASWGEARIDEYTIDGERMHYLSDGIEELFNKYFGDLFDDKNLDPEYMKQMVGLTKAIFIKIELPINIQRR